jgi:hypothetical protein
MSLKTTLLQYEAWLRIPIEEQQNHLNDKQGAFVFVALLSRLQLVAVQLHY